MKLPAEKVARLRSFYQGRKVCVTGGAGFIGGHLVDALLSLDASITVLDDLSSSSLDHLAGLIELAPERVRFVRGSVLDPDAVGEALEGAETIFHLAAIGSVPRSLLEPRRVWSVNADGTLRILEAARHAGAARVVLAASSSAYGNAPGLPRVETQLPSPESPYAASKLAAEQLLAVWASCYTLSTVALRYFNVFGPRQSQESDYAAAVAAFAKKILAGQSPIIYGDGSQTRDFTFVADTVLATLLAGAAPAGTLRGEVINVGTGRSTTVLELARGMARAAGAAEMAFEHRPPRSGEAKHSQADITRARKLLGYEPTVAFEEGLRQTVEWYRGAPAAAQEGS